MSTTTIPNITRQSRQSLLSDSRVQQLSLYENPRSHNDNTTEYSSYDNYSLLTPEEKQLYFNRNYLVEEGMRRNQLQDINLERLREQINYTDNDIIKNDMENIISNNQWRNYIFKNINPQTNQIRSRQDITTDYNPNIIGCPRQWMECHQWKN